MTERKKRSPLKDSNENDLKPKTLNYDLGKMIEAFFKGDIDTHEYVFSLLFIMDPENYDMGKGKIFFDDFSIGFMSTEIKLVEDFENSCHSYFDSLNQNNIILDYDNYSNYLKGFSKTNIRNNLEKYFELCEIYLTTLFINTSSGNKWLIHSKKFWSEYPILNFKAYWYYLGTVLYNTVEVFLKKYGSLIDNIINDKGKGGKHNFITMISKRG